jgi:hypothetical protein
MTVARLEAEMPNAEYIEWSMYYALQAQQAELAQRTAGRR